MGNKEINLSQESSKNGSQREENKCFAICHGWDGLDFFGMDGIGPSPEKSQNGVPRALKKKMVQRVPLAFLKINQSTVAGFLVRACAHEPKVTIHRLTSPNKNTATFWPVLRRLEGVLFV